MEAPRRVIKLGKQPKPSAPTLIETTIKKDDPHWFKVGAFKLIRIGNHVFEPYSKTGDEVNYTGLWDETTEYIDTTADEPEGLEEKAKAFLKEQRK